MQQKQRQECNEGLYLEKGLLHCIQKQQKKGEKNDRTIQEQENEW